MAQRPNILFLMTDQMQGRVLDPEHPCRVPTFDALAARGVRVRRAYTPNPVCSPARASLMTGLLPHSHGVLQVTHCMPDDVGVLRRDHPHWAQHLRRAGYRTGYFGKWHVENTESPTDFGWETAPRDRIEGSKPDILAGWFSGPPGYPPFLLYGVTSRPMAQRHLGITVERALGYLDDVTRGNQPWCCFVSVIEPHDPFVCSAAALGGYDIDSIPVPANWDDDLAGRPGQYRKSARTYAGMTLRQKKEAAACYYAMISEIDTQYARLIQRLAVAGQLDNTIIVLTSDHGEMLGAHGLYTKNVGAYEEAYEIPMVLAGPGITGGSVAEARVGLHDLGATLVDLCGLDPFVTAESRSFAALLRDPGNETANYQRGYAEYFGTRYWYTQRILWDGPWKLVWNGFDFDELYNLDEDHGEMRNLAEQPEHQDRLRAMLRQAWAIVGETEDAPLRDSFYPSLRLATYGPGEG